MNILYCGDKNIEDGLLISILSLLKNVQEELNIYVMTMSVKTESKKYEEIPNSTIEFLDNRVKTENENNFVRKIDTTNLFLNDMPEANMDTRFTPYCMLRLYIDQIQDMPDKIMYLDNDVVCRQDCTEFYNQDIEGLELVGTLDHYGKWFFKNNFFKFDYINSGVLLLNLKKIKETKLFEKCRKKCKEENMFMPDQSAINKLATAKKIVPRKYNEQRKMHEDTVLQHFTTSFRFLPWLHTITVKPWNIEQVHNKLKIFEYDDILEEYSNNINNMKLVKERV